MLEHGLARGMNRVLIQPLGMLWVVFCACCGCDQHGAQLLQLHLGRCARAPTACVRTPCRLFVDSIPVYVAFLATTYTSGRGNSSRRLMFSSAVDRRHQPPALTASLV